MLQTVSPNRTLVSNSSRFARWLGTTAETVDRALADSFERVGLDGSIDSREAILERIRGMFGTYETSTFEIDIRNVECIEAKDDWALARYEEWQTAPSGTNARLSTSVFARNPEDQERTVEWCYLQETWIDPP